MKIVRAGVLMVSCFWLTVGAQAQTFSQADRDLLIEIKTKLESNDRRVTELREDINLRFEQIDKRFEQIDKRFEQVDVRLQEMFNFFQLMIGALVAILVAIIGFAYWDRRTIIHKAKQETLEDLNHRGPLKVILNVLKERSKTDAELERILKEYHLL